MVDQEQILGLVARIYDAVADAKVWPIFLEELTDVLDCHAAVLVSSNAKTLEGQVLASARIDPAFLKSYATHYAAIDPWTEAWAALPTRAVACTDQRLPRGKLVRTEFYNDWLRPQGIFRSIGSTLLREDHDTVRIGIPRTAKQGPYDGGLRRSLGVLVPHIERALQLERRLSQSGIEGRAAIDALDRWSQGFVLVDDRMRVSMMNRAASEMVGSGDGLMLHDRCLHALRESEDASLQKLVFDAIQTTRKEGSASAGETAVTRPSGLTPYAVLVTPLPAQPRGLFPEPAAAAIFVNDPAARPETTVDSLRRRFGLTPTEARLTARLVFGERLYTAADSLEMSRETARRHLKSVFRKTGTHGQPELIGTLILASTARPGGE